MNLRNISWQEDIIVDQLRIYDLGLFRVVEVSFLNRSFVLLELLQIVSDIIQELINVYILLDAWSF